MSKPQITTVEALQLAGKVEIDRLHDVIAAAARAIEDGRRGDALKLLQTEVRNRKVIDKPAIQPGQVSA